MATRPVFLATSSGLSLVRKVDIDFTWHPGMARAQRQRSMRALHDAIRATMPDARVLEVSSLSETPLGTSLSAFNLTFVSRGRGTEVSVECAFQASKVFENGGPYDDLLHVTPREAKRDPRLQESGRLTGFRFFGEPWPLEPQTAFYDWIYLNALHRNHRLAQSVLEWDAFTDIAFNPQKSVNCQASSVALYVSLARRSEIAAALSSREAFLTVLAGQGRAGQRLDDGPQGRLF